MAIFTERHLRRWRIFWIVLTLFFLGIILIVVAHGVPKSNDWRDLPLAVLGEVGVAAIVASLLAALVDTTLKENLVKDAVGSALGYLLPDELKPELKWVYGLEILADQTFHARLEHDQENDTVILHGRISRTLENISGKTVKAVIQGGCEEWFRPGAKAIIERCDYAIIRKGETVSGPRIKVPCQKTEARVSYRAPLIDLAPEDRLDFFFAYRSPMHDHGVEEIAYRYAIRSPRITAEVPNTLVGLITVSHRSRYDLEEMEAVPWQSGALSQSVRGVLLPHQPIFIRWHRADKFNERRAEK